MKIIDYRCSFCEAHVNVTDYLVQSPINPSQMICNNCITIANNIGNEYLLSMKKDRDTTPVTEECRDEVKKCLSHRWVKNNVTQRVFCAFCGVSKYDEGGHIWND